VNVPGNDGKKSRARRNYNNLPTLCNDEMTQAVLSLVGPGDYEADTGNSYAELKLANDGDTITCNVTWDHAATPGVVTTNMYITVRAPARDLMPVCFLIHTYTIERSTFPTQYPTQANPQPNHPQHKQVRDGPVYDTDRLDTTGNNTFPLWASFQADLYANATRTGGAPPQPTRTSVSLSAALPRSMTSSATRIVGCTVVGEDPQTKLPITVFATSKILPDGALPWEDFEYPIATKPCNVTGCISSVAKGLGGPSLLAAGRAAYLPGAGSRDALYVRVQDSPQGLFQVLPPLVNATHSLTAEAVYSTTSVVNTPSALPELMGWQVDGQGRLYTTGKVADGGYKSPVGFVAALDFSSPPARYTTTAKVQRAGIYSDFYCIQTSIQPYYVSFGGITSAWLEPASGDLFVVDAYCSAIYRVEASALQPNCASPGFCGTIHHVGPAYKSFYDIDIGYFVGDHGKVGAGVLDG
jgi:hypothetical protein